MGLLSTKASSSGFQTTMSAPRKETVAAEVSTSAMLCEMYPSAVKAPQRMACSRIAGLSSNKKGESAIAASRKRADEVALAGSASFISRPSGKFVPYSTEQPSSSAEGHHCEAPSASGFVSHLTWPSSSSRKHISGDLGSAITHTPRAQMTPSGPISSPSASVTSAAFVSAASIQSGRETAPLNVERGGL